MDFLEIITIFELASTSSKRVTLVPIFFRKNQSPAPLFLLFRKNPGCAPKKKTFAPFSLGFFLFACLSLFRGHAPAARFVAKTKVQIRLIISHIEFMDFEYSFLTARRLKKVQNIKRSEKGDCNTLFWLHFIKNPLHVHFAATAPPHVSICILRISISFLIHYRRSVHKNTISQDSWAKKIPRTDSYGG